MTTSKTRSMTQRLTRLFRINHYRTAENLREKVGPLFAQGVYRLRQNGWTIKTVSLGSARKVAYKATRIPA